MNIASTPSNTPPEISELLELCYPSVSLFGPSFLSEAFSTPFCALHHEMITRIDDTNAQKVVIAAPRGIGKTTLVKAYAEKCICYRDYEFILYVSNSETIAAMQTENIKRELRSNRQIRQIFGDIQISVDDPELDESFSKKSWVSFGTTLVMPRGAGQQVRGLLYRNTRPQLIIVDDLEKKDELENPENRRKLKEWFFGDLMKCIDRYSNKWRIIYIDTLKHHDALLETLLNDPTWNAIRLDLCDDDYTSQAPYLITTDELRAEAESHRAKGLLHVFYMEYRNAPTAREEMGFREEYFKYFDIASIDANKLEFIIIVDPAKTANMKSADSAIVGLGIDYVTGAIYVWDIVSGKMFPDELYNEMFSMRRRLGAHAIGIEVTGLEEFIKQPIMNEMLRRGPLDSFEPVWLKSRGGGPDSEPAKLKRIGTLVPYYRQGYMYHNRNCCAKLESQLLSFPRSGLLDCADATAYFIEMLEIGQRYFQTPPDPEKDFDPEDEFRELEYDEPLQGIRIV